MVKSKGTYRQIAARKDKAVRFLRDVLHDSERADEVEDESVEDYAERRHLRIVNPRAVSPHIQEIPRERRVKTMDKREKLEDVLSDRDELLDKLQGVRDEIDDVLSEYDGDEDDTDDDDSNDDDNGQ